MTEDQFQHHMVLAAIIINSIRSVTHEGFIKWAEQDASESDLFNEQTSRLILADTCAELIRRSGVKPKMPFTIQAKSEAA